MTIQKIQQIVIVIESPSADDVLMDRREGYALVSALRLAEVPHRYFAVSNLETFKKAIDEVASIPASISKIAPNGQVLETQISMPNLHISAHGNESGIALTDGTYITWPQLADLLDGMNRHRGYVFKENERPRSMIPLAMSSCKGFYAKEILSLRSPSPVLAVIGSEQDVAWPDALTAWITYYHLLVTRKCNGKIALERMNAAASENGDIFKAYMDRI